MGKYLFGNIETEELKYATKCMICNNLIKISHDDAMGICLKICDECKEAIKFVKEIMSQDGVLVKDEKDSYKILKYKKVL